MASSNYYDATVPLFGDDSTQVRTMDLAFAAVNIIFVIVTLALSFTRVEANRENIFFGIVLILVTTPVVVLVLWFRRGDLHPKFRYLIAYMMTTNILLCMSGMGYIYFHNGLCSKP
eukprot:m.902697 g.902697  ORF g.902697 m.902697 type:complete len:116 (+) comp23692_c0_seq3:266-613(+)